MGLIPVKSASLMSSFGFSFAVRRKNSSAKVWFRGNSSCPLNSQGLRASGGQGGASRCNLHGWGSSNFSDARTCAWNAGAGTLFPKLQVLPVQLFLSNALLERQVQDVWN